jgi:hypothetical protein
VHSIASLRTDPPVRHRRPMMPLFPPLNLGEHGPPSDLLKKIFDLTANSGLTEFPPSRAPDGVGRGRTLISEVNSVWTTLGSPLDGPRTSS